MKTETARQGFRKILQCQTVWKPVQRFTYPYSSNKCTDLLLCSSHLL